MKHLLGFGCSIITGGGWAICSVCVCVCVWARETQRARDRHWETKRQRAEWFSLPEAPRTHALQSVSLSQAAVPTTLWPFQMWPRWQKHAGFEPSWKPVWPTPSNDNTRKLKFPESMTPLNHRESPISAPTWRINVLVPRSPEQGSEQSFDLPAWEEWLYIMKDCFWWWECFDKILKNCILLQLIYPNPLH